jgi:hypothetical protein
MTSGPHASAAPSLSWLTPKEIALRDAAPVPVPELFFAFQEPGQRL